MNADKIFDAIGRLGSMSVLFDRRRKKQREIFELKAKCCGNCDHWMKSSCAPEKVHKQFKSCSSIACADFAIKGWVTDLTVERQEELKVIDSEIRQGAGKQEKGHE
jgi:hypothetical protein